MRARLWLLALLFGAICFLVGYLARPGADPPQTPPTATVSRPDRPPTIQIDETKVELLPGQALQLDAGPPPNVSSH